MPKTILTLKELIEFASAQADKIFRKRGVIYPMYHAIKANGEHLVLMSPDSDKDVAVALIKSAFVLEDVESYVFIDEAWTINTSKTGRSISDAEWEAIQRYGLRNHPDRREVVMFGAENRRGERLQGQRFILRPEIGKPSLAPLTIDDMTNAHSVGRMVGLLRTEK